MAFIRSGGTGIAPAQAAERELRFAVHGEAQNGREFATAFAAVPTAAGLRIIKTPVQAPRANAVAERWIASARRECLDRMLITSERHLRLVLAEYTDHYNSHRPHRALQQKPPRTGRELGC